MSKPVSPAEMKDWANETWIQCLTEAWNEGKRMTDRELFERALDALDSDNPDIQLRTAIALRERLAQPEQEHTGFIDSKINPIQRPWVGLTDEEIEPAADQSDHYSAFHHGVSFAEAKLKEKNCG
jgi:hypothetical protein